MRMYATISSASGCIQLVYYAPTGHEAAARVMNAARDFGYTDGLVVPLHGRDRRWTPEHIGHHPVLERVTGGFRGSSPPDPSCRSTRRHPPPRTHAVAAAGQS